MIIYSDGIELIPPTSFTSSMEVANLILYS